MSHPRVVHKKDPHDVYVGRHFGKDAPQSSVDRFENKWANPFRVTDHGKEAMRLYLDYLRDDPKGRFVVQLAPLELSGATLGCWGCRPVCHADVLARLADGDDLEQIRADVLAVLFPPKTRSLFT